MNERYSYGNERFLSGQINWLTGTFRVVLLDTNNYVFLKDVHHSLADIPLAARVAISAPLVGMTATNGTARATDVIMGPVYGQQIEALAIYHERVTELTSELIVYADNAHGLPFIPQGDMVRIRWDTGPNGIFTL